MTTASELEPLKRDLHVNEFESQCKLHRLESSVAAICNLLRQQTRQSDNELDVEALTLFLNILECIEQMTLNN